LLIGGRVSVHVALISASSSVPPSNNPKTSPATRLPHWGLASTLSHVEATKPYYPYPPHHCHRLHPPRLLTPSVTTILLCCTSNATVLYHNGRHTFLTHLPGGSTSCSAVFPDLVLMAATLLSRYLPAIGDRCLESRAEYLRRACSGIHTLPHTLIPPTSFQLACGFRVVHQSIDSSISFSDS